MAWFRVLSARLVGAPTRVLVGIGLVVGVLVVTPTPGAAEEAAGVAYRPPVDAVVSDPFRPPPNPYGVGNRGLTYDLTPGASVVASADGEVAFAGQVGGTLHVTIGHADGLRTSYSFLTTVSVVRGTSVSAGDPIGSAGAGFHFGVRDGDTYLDPATLFGATRTQVRLVPHGEAPTSAAALARDRAALAGLVRDRGLVDAVRARLVGGARRGVEILRNGAIVARRLDPSSILGDGAVAAVEQWRRPCTPRGAAGSRATDPAPGPATALLVGGYGSHSSDAAIDDVDTDSLGYDAGDVVRFSYQGGRVPSTGLAPKLAGLDATTYAPSDTFDDLVAAGGRLADLIMATAAARPGHPVDVYAHSQGGIVTRIALEELAARPGGIDALGVVVTIGTPHRGADLATVAQILTPRTHLALDQTVGRLADVDASSTAVRQMASGSDLIRRLVRDGVPDGVDFRTIGARGDVIVTGDKTDVDGHPSVIVDLVGPSAHDRLPGAAVTTQELALARAGRPPSCESAAGTVLDAVVPRATSWAGSALATVLAGL